MELSEVLDTAIAPAMDILGFPITPKVRVLLFAIGLQESRFEHRRQLGNGPARAGCKIRRPAEVLTHRDGSDHYLTCSEVRQWLLPILRRGQPPFPDPATEPRYSSAYALIAGKFVSLIAASSTSPACPAPTSVDLPTALAGIHSTNCCLAFARGVSTRAPHTTNTTEGAGSKFATNGGTIQRPLWRGQRGADISREWSLTAKTRTAHTHQATASSLRTTRILVSAETHSVTRKLPRRFGSFWLAAHRSRPQPKPLASNTWSRGT